MNISPNLTTKKVLIFPPTRSLQKFCKIDSISCRENRFSIQRRRTNFYEVLSLDSVKVGFDEIKKAYRSMALQHHPDVCPPSRKEESTKRFVELQRAYETLSDPNSRKKYDFEIGLGESTKYEVWGMQSRERRSSFPKEVWENQLSGLKRRSYDRMEMKKKKGCICM